MKVPINEANAPHRKKFTPRVSVLFSIVVAMGLHFDRRFNTLALECKIYDLPMEKDVQLP